MPNIQVNDIQMYYEVQGEGEPLLLLHGLGSSTLDWEMQVPALVQQYQVWTVDVRGHGKSEKPEGAYSIRLFAEDILAFLREMKLDKVDAIGLSMGGMIAFEIASFQPEVLKSMVIINSGPEVKAFNSKERRAIWMRKILTPLFSMKALAKVLSKRLFPEEHQQELRDRLYERWVQNDKKTYRKSFKALLNWGVAEHLSKMQIPTIFLASDMDYTPVSRKEMYAQQMPNATVKVIENSRHASVQDQPEKINEAILEFLDKVS